MELSPLMWIIIGVVALVVIAALIIAFGLRRSKAKQISFEKKDEIEQKKPTSGNYQAQSGFNFTSGGGTTTSIGGVDITKPEEDKAQEPVLRDGQELKAPAGDDAKSADDAEKVDDTEVVPPAPSIDEVSEAPKAEDLPEHSEQVEQTPAEDALLGERIEEEIDKPAETPEQQLEEAEAAPAPTEAPTEAPAQQETSPVAPKGTQADGLVASDKVEEPEQPAATAPAQDEIAPVQGRMGKLRGRMSKSQNVIGRGVLGILSAGDLDEDAWEDIEDTLLMADLGTKTTLKVVEDLRERIAVNGVSSEAEARAMLRSALIDACKPEMDRSIKAMPYDGKPAVIMVVGVNGTGKTTTTGKLSRVLIGMGHSVTLGAADTFRAAAADQLETWGRRVGAKTVRGAEGADPASVAFDSVAKGIDDGTDVVLIDTAGRLHTSVGLMDQLGKVKRVVEKKAKVDEVLLVLDATVGQNGLMQARVFREVVDITGVVLTKLDGTAKGGIVFQVQEELGVPVKLVGLGEGADHLAPFEVESFVDALLG